MTSVWTFSAEPSVQTNPAVGPEPTIRSPTEEKIAAEFISIPDRVEPLQQQQTASQDDAAASHPLMTVMNSKGCSHRRRGNGGFLSFLPGWMLTASTSRGVT